MTQTTTLSCLCCHTGVVQGLPDNDPQQPEESSEPYLVIYSTAYNSSIISYYTSNNNSFSLYKDLNELVKS